MGLQIIKEALLSVSTDVYHFNAGKNAKLPHIVWAEDGENSFSANNRRNEFSTTGTIDLFTLDEYDPLSQSIPDALDKTPAAWYLNSIQYEQETGIIHYEWVFEV